MLPGLLVLVEIRERGELPLAQKALVHLLGRTLMSVTSEVLTTVFTSLGAVIVVHVRQGLLLGRQRRGR